MSKSILNKQYEVDSVFLRFPFTSLCFLDIKNYSSKSSKSYVYNGLTRLVSEKLINIQKFGPRSIVYSLNISTALSQSYWGSLKEFLSWENKQLPFRLIESLYDKMPVSFFCFIVTGSYAKKTQTKNSDIDLVIISESNSNEIYNELKYISEISIPKVHLQVFTKKEFLSMLLSKKENFGKEVVRNNLVLVGGSVFYSILNEAILNGFSG